MRENPTSQRNALRSCGCKRSIINRFTKGFDSPVWVGGRANSVHRATCPALDGRLVAALLAFALFSASALTLPEWSWRLRSELAEASLDQFSPDVHEALAAIPESDCVYTTGFFAAALAARPHIFEVGPYASYPIDPTVPTYQPDFIVLDERYPEEIDAMAEQIADWEAEGFVTSYRKVGVLRILKKVQTGSKSGAK